MEYVIRNVTLQNVIGMIMTAPSLLNAKSVGMYMFPAVILLLKKLIIRKNLKYVVN